MVSKDKIMSTVVSFLNIKLDEIGANIPLLTLFRPMVTAGINNKLNKLDNILSFVADDKGLIDAEKIIGEMLDNLIVMPIQYFPDVFKGLHIGKGVIGIDIPFINQTIEFNSADIESFINLLNKE